MIIDWMKQANLRFARRRIGGIARGVDVDCARYVRSFGTRFHAHFGRPFVLENGSPVMSDVDSYYLPFASRPEVIRVHEDAVAVGANRCVRSYRLTVRGSEIGRNDPYRELRIGRDGMKYEPACVEPITLSVVICAHTLDRWDDLRRAVASVRTQIPPVHETIVVIDHNDALRERASRELDGATVLANSRDPGLSGARTTGVSHASGSVVAFVDDDAAAAPGWAAALCDAYCDPVALGAGGPVEPDWQVPRPSWFPAEFDWVVGCTYAGMDVRNGRMRNPIGANMSVRADVLRRVGGFSTELGRRKLGFSVSGIARLAGKAESCEETELCIRAAELYPGGYFAYRDGARVSHKVPAQRATWRYFTHRCLVEGAAKATLAAIAGTDGLGAENRYVREVLPHAVVRALASGTPGRAGAIVAGFALTAFAYARIRLRSMVRTRARQKSRSVDAPAANAAPRVTDISALPTKGMGE
jgi:glycosyltransferase involved in cell wall biosynthesis